MSLRHHFLSAGFPGDRFALVVVAHRFRHVALPRVEQPRTSARGTGPVPTVLAMLPDRVDVTTTEQPAERIHHADQRTMRASDNTSPNGGGATSRPWSNLDVTRLYVSWPENCLTTTREQPFGSRCSRVGLGRWPSVCRIPRNVFAYENVRARGPKILLRLASFCAAVCWPPRLTRRRAASHHPRDSRNNLVAIQAGVARNV